MSGAADDAGIDRGDEGRLPSQWEGLPITPLGHDSGTYYVLSRAGQVRQITARDMRNPLSLVDLTGGANAALAEAFPRRSRGRDGEPGDIIPGAVNWTAAAESMIAACQAQGIWSMATAIRGPGVWGLGDGGVLVHCGDELLLDGRFHPAGRRIGGAIYHATAAIERPAPRPASAEDGRALLRALEARRWKHPLHARMLLGWIGQAALAAAIPWRAHCYITAERGAGKTTLMRLVSDALGGAAHPPETNVTGAGLVGMLSSTARGVLYDEAENKLRTREIVESLVRALSGAEGARVTRGNPSGGSRSQTLHGAALMASILVPPLQPQDRTRICVLELRRPEGGHLDLAGERAMARRIGPGLWRRAIDGLPRFLSTLDAWRRDIIAAGADERQADQYGTLMAGAELLLEDEPLDSDSRAEIIAMMAGLLAEAAASGEDEGEGQQCLTHLWTSRAETWTGGSKQTIGQLLLRALEDSAIDERGALEACGIKVQRTIVQGGTRVTLHPSQCTVAIAVEGAELERVFRGTRWELRAWNSALRHLDGAEASTSTIRFAGARIRATIIPPRYLPGIGGEE